MTTVCIFIILWTIKTKELTFMKCKELRAGTKYFKNISQTKKTRAKSFVTNFFDVNKRWSRSAVSWFLFSIIRIPFNWHLDRSGRFLRIKVTLLSPVLGLLRCRAATDEPRLSNFTWGCTINNVFAYFWVEQVRSKPVFCMSCKGYYLFY